MDFVQASLQFNAVGAGHLDVEESQIPVALGQSSQCRAGTFGLPHFVSFLSKPFAQGVAHDQFVIHNQQIAFGVHAGRPRSSIVSPGPAWTGATARTGSVMVNTVSRFGYEATLMRP